MKKKKELQEKVAALKKQRDEHLNQLMASETPLSGEHKVTYDTREKELAEAEESLRGLEELEQQAKANQGAAGARIEVGQNLAATRPWASLGEQLQAIAYAGQGRGVDPRLTMLAPSGASEAVPSDGGFLVQQDYSTQLLAMAHEVGQIAPRCTQIPIGANFNGIKLPIVNETSRATGSRWGGVRVYRANESDTVTATKPKFDLLDIRLEKLMALFYATDEVLQDAVALERIASIAFAEEFAYTVDDEILNGDGVAKCLGVLNSPALVTVSKESGQAADTVAYENIVKMYARMPARSRRNAAWFINQDVEPQLALMKIVDSTLTFPVYLPPGGASAAPYATLLGRPVIPLEQSATTGDVGDILFADMTQYLLATKGGLNSASSMHVRFLSDEMTFRWTYRVNGQPAWKLAKTPAKGSNTLSPFVVLEAR